MSAAEVREVWVRFPVVPFIIMTYDVFRKIMSKEAFLSFKPDRSDITLAIIDMAYNKYVVKCKVFQRDDFTCQHSNCKSEKELTMHHVKLQKNGGKNTVRNCVTLCDKCHKAYHESKLILVFDNPALPSHIHGHMFKVSENDSVNWKKLKKELKKFRRGLRGECNYHLSEETLIILFEYLRKIQE